MLLANKNWGVCIYNLLCLILVKSSNSHEIKPWNCPESSSEKHQSRLLLWPHLLARLVSASSPWWSSGFPLPGSSTWRLHRTLLLLGLPCDLSLRWSFAPIAIVRMVFAQGWVFLLSSTPIHQESSRPLIRWCVHAPVSSSVFSLFSGLWSSNDHIYFAVQIVPAQAIGGSCRWVLHPSDVSPGFSGAQLYLLASLCPRPALDSIASSRGPGCRQWCLEAQVWTWGVCGNWGCHCRWLPQHIYPSCACLHVSAHRETRSPRTHIPWLPIQYILVPAPQRTTVASGSTYIYRFSPPTMHVPFNRLSSSEFCSDTNTLQLLFSFFFFILQYPVSTSRLSVLS